MLARDALDVLYESGPDGKREATNIVAKLMKKRLAGALNPNII